MFIMFLGTILPEISFSEGKGTSEVHKLEIALKNALPPILRFLQKTVAHIDLI